MCARASNKENHDFREHRLETIEILNEDLWCLSLARHSRVCLSLVGGVLIRIDENEDKTMEKGDAGDGYRR